MPAGFDPVRDAARSPTDTRAPPFPTAPDAAQAKPPSRRATDLAMLLNAGPAAIPPSPLFTPHAPGAGRREYFTHATDTSAMHSPTAARSSVHALLSPAGEDVRASPAASSSRRSSLLDLISPTNDDGSRRGSFAFSMPAAADAGSSPEHDRSSSRPSSSRSLFGGPASPRQSPMATTRTLPPLESPRGLSGVPATVTSDSSVSSLFKSPSTQRVEYKTPSPSIATQPVPLPPPPRPAVPAMAMPPRPLPPQPRAPSEASPRAQERRPPSIPAKPARAATPPPPPPPKRSTLAYAPRHRLTPPTSVLQPLTPQEEALYADPHNWQGFRKLSKRPLPVAGVKRSAPSPANDDDVAPPAKRSRDVTLIAGHYNARPDVGKGAREASPIIGLKNFNNWVKSVLILRFAHPALAASPRASGPPPPGFRARGGKVLDMGCGKGGDLSKWARAPVAEYVGVDIAAVSVDQARARWADMRGQRFQADFAPLDCFVQSLADGIKPARLARAFDVVSMQFCMHYAFETPAKARRMLENVGRWLRKGGVFVGTIPNAELLMANLDAVPEGAPLQWGNGVYSIAFEARTPRPAFGHRYRFFLRDAVDDVPEYVVRWETLVALAAEQGLHPVYHEEFHQVYAEHADHAEYGPLLVRMKVQDAQGESQMDEEQWEAANVYLAFAFEKR